MGIGVALNIAGRYRLSAMMSLPSRQPITRNPQPATLSTLIFLIPIIAGIFTFRFPYSLPLYLAGAGVILASLVRWRPLRPLLTGVLYSGIILSFQTACTVPYFKIAARYHETPILSPFFCWILKALGASASCSQGTIFIQTSQANMEIVPSWEKMGLFVIVTCLAGGLVFQYLSYGNLFRPGFWRKAGILALVLAVYMAVRFIVLSMIFVETARADMFWLPVMVTLSFLPLPFILWRFVRYDEAEFVYGGDGRPVTGPAPQSLIFNLQASAAVFLFAVSLVTCLWYQDPGNVKDGRILIDEFYSDWEWTDKEFNTEWYGVQSVYNYYCFADYLNHFYSVERLRDAVTAARLKDTDVFVVKTPTSSFSEQEIEAIEDFVEGGGGLFLIGDHTNVFGTTINLNPLAERFGFKFNYDATYDLVTSDLHFHKKNRLYQHPSVSAMPYFLFATSCSMQAPFLAEDTMIVSNLKTMYLDYSRGGYFPEKNKVLNYTFGLFLQSSGVKYGRGRVMAFADSTCFSNFYMHIPGKPGYVLGSINWLNRTNRYDSLVKAVSVAVMILSVGFMVWLFVVIKCGTQNIAAMKSSVGWMFFAGLLGVVAATQCNGLLARRSYALPAPHTPMINIGFEEELCSFRIPSVQLLHNPPVDFQTFYVWTQRLGYIPTLFSLDGFEGESWKDSQPRREGKMEEFDMVVMVNPRRYLEKSEIERIDRYVTDGGKLLIIDHPKGLKSIVNQIIGQYGMKVDHGGAKEKVDIYEGTEHIGTLPSAAPIEGGKELLTDDENNTLAALVEHGEGMIVTLACSTSFTNEEMGNTETIPDEHQQFLYKMEFWLISSMINGHFGRFQDY